MPRGISARLDFNANNLGRNINKLPEKVDGYIHTVMVRQSISAVAYMKVNARWTDRTGNARNGLSTEVEWKPKELHAIRLFHRMWYGIFLETRWAGRYAIILPTIQKFGPETMQLLDRLFRKLGGGA